jgi:hypothetical protein
MTTSWHADESLLGWYAEGRLDPARAASVEQHLTGCARCRAAVAPHADAALLARAWSDTVDVLDRPKATLFEQALTGLGLSAPSARLAAGAVAARGPWILGCVLVAAFAFIARDVDGRTAVWFLTAAPLVPLTGVAVAYGPGSFPMYDLVAAAPYPRLRLVLLRSLPVLPVTIVILIVGGLVLPRTEVAALWLLPGLALATLSLVAERVVGAGLSVTVLALLWFGFVISARVATGSALAAFSPAVQLLSLSIVIAVAAVVVLGRHWTRRLS